MPDKVHTRKATVAAVERSEFNMRMVAARRDLLFEPGMLATQTPKAAS